MLHHTTPHHDPTPHTVATAASSLSLQVRTAVTPTQFSYRCQPPLNFTTSVNSHSLFLPLSPTHPPPGLATDASGGDISLVVGTGDTNDGGDVLITAGRTTASAHQGGSVFVTGGEGSWYVGGGDEKIIR